MFRYFVLREVPVLDDSIEELFDAIKSYSKNTALLAAIPGVTEVRGPFIPAGARKSVCCGKEILYQAFEVTAETGIADDLGRLKEQGFSFYTLEDPEEPARRAAFLENVRKERRPETGGSPIH